MYNSDTPTRAELPTSGQLIRSTLIALATAATLLVTVVLPAEYGIDPTGLGRALQLTKMGEIKQQLSAEAAKDAPKEQQAKAASLEPVAEAAPPIPVAEPTPMATAEPAAPVAEPTPVIAGRKDEMSVTLKPDQGAEIKMQMRKGAKANYSWTIAGGVVNFDEHGDGGADNAISYEKGKAVANKEGVLEAAFDGIHGWYWRNRGKADVTVTLRTDGEYAAIQRME